MNKFFSIIKIGEDKNRKYFICFYVKKRELSHFRFSLMLEDGETLKEVIKKMEEKGFEYNYVAPEHITEIKKPPLNRYISDNTELFDFIEFWVVFGNYTDND